MRSCMCLFKKTAFNLLREALQGGGNQTCNSNCGNSICCISSGAHLPFQSLNPVVQNWWLPLLIGPLAAISLGLYNLYIVQGNRFFVGILQLPREPRLTIWEQLP